MGCGRSNSHWRLDDGGRYWACLIKRAEARDWASREVTMVVCSGLELRGERRCEFGGPLPGIWRLGICGGGTLAPRRLCKRRATRFIFGFRASYTWLMGYVGNTMFDDIN